MSKNNDNYRLPVQTNLEHYTIKQTLSAGGFSIVYLCIDNIARQQVVIKEYMPCRLACRLEDLTVAPNCEENTASLAEGRKLFFQEASALAKLQHPNIVKVTNFFNANNTVYMVMDYIPGRNLEDYIRRHQGSLSENFLRTIFPPLLEGLQTVHDAGLLHLDIKPGNIHLLPGGQPLLLDFGAVHRLQLSRQYQPRPVVTCGFAPIEQYDVNGYVGPWTDIYAIGATMRACIEGKAPPHAKNRRIQDAMPPAVIAFKRRYSKDILHILDWAMDVDPELRPQSVKSITEKLNARTRSTHKKTIINRWVGNLPWNR